MSSLKGKKHRIAKIILFELEVITLTLYELKSNITIQGSVRIDSYDNNSEDITTIFETFDFETASISSEILAKEVKYMYSFNTDETTGICIEV